MSRKQERKLQPVVQVRVPRSLWKAARHEAAERETSLRSVLAAALEKSFGKKAQAGEVRTRL